ncbi:MAG: hypothetical protein IJU73_02505 [Ruminococcus sp.]|nr:hypothetical protein [Ruminococcus sp.]
MDYDNFGGNDNRKAAESLKRQRAIAQMKRERRKKLLIRRTVIVLVCLLIVFLVIFLLVQAFKAIFGGSSAKPQEETAAETIEAVTEAPTVNEAMTFNTPNIKDDGKSEGQYSSSNGGVYIYNKMALELFGSSEAGAKDYAATISEFKKNAPDFTVYNMVVPNHTEFALPKRLIDAGVTAGSQAENIKQIYLSYTEDVKPINCYNKLCEHIDEYLFFNTDHHWTGLGAYYAYQAFCEQTGQTPLDLTTCEEHTIADFEGSLIDNDQSLYENLDTVHYWTFPYQTHAMRQDNPGEDLYETTVYYEQEGSGRYSYGVFIYGDSPLFIEYNDTLDNGKKIAVVKESYGNSFVPYLTNNYQEVHVIDFRYFGQNLKSYMQDHGITEVLFINNVMSANAAVQLDRIKALY